MNPAQAAVLVALMLILSQSGVWGCRGASPREPQEPASGGSPLNTLTAHERQAGWILLFNGKDFSGWRGLGQQTIPEGHWRISDNCIHKRASGDVDLQPDGQPLDGGDLVTGRTFLDFELSLEWRISRGGNSGIKYNVSEELSMAVPPAAAALGFEYQILDDLLHPDAANGADRTAAALYDLIEPGNKNLRPVGEFNHTRIVFRGGHGEHWLNGVKVLDFDLGTPRMTERLQASKYRDIPGFSKKRRGHIVLQDHTDEAWFRNIKIRDLEPGAGPGRR